MGGSSSREIVVPGGPLVLPSAQAPSSAPSDAQRRSDELYQSAEATIFQEGYRQGASEAAARYSEGAELAVKAAFSRSLVEEEARREKELEAMIAALRKSQYRAPQKPLECQVEEAAVLACKAPADCAPVIDAYVSCARKVVDSLMKPKLG